MPKLIRLYITHCAIGFGIAVAFVVMLVWLDVAHLRHLVLETEMGWLAGLMMVLANGVVFAGVQFAIAVMRMAEAPEGPKGGTRVPVVRMELVRVEAKANASSRR
ncbi:MAG: hypothetical protein WCC57_20085 [Paracoccaceae bacterium]